MDRPDARTILEKSSDYKIPGFVDKHPHTKSDIPEELGIAQYVVDNATEFWNNLANYTIDDPLIEIVPEKKKTPKKTVYRKTIGTPIIKGKAENTFHRVVSKTQQVHNVYSDAEFKRQSERIHHFAKKPLPSTKETNLFIDKVTKDQHVEKKLLLAQNSYKSNKALASRIPTLQLTFQEKLIYLLARPNHPLIVVKGHPNTGKTTQVTYQVGRFNDMKGTILLIQPNKIKQQMAKNSINQFGSIGDQPSQTNRKLIITTYDEIIPHLFTNPTLFLDYKAVIIDDVQSRTTNLDLILLFIKQVTFQLKSRPNSIEAEKLRNMKFILIMNYNHNRTNLLTILQYFYWDLPTQINVPKVNCELIHVKQVSTYKRITQTPNISFPQKITEHLIYTLNNIKTNRLGTLSHTCSGKQLTSSTKNRDIICFMPSEKYILYTLHELSKHKPKTTGFKFLTINQSLTTRPSKNNEAINVTLTDESSLILPGIKFVIDTGLKEFTKYNYLRQYYHKTLSFVSAEETKQRQLHSISGEDGYVYQFYSSGQQLDITPTQIHQERIDPLIWKTRQLEKLELTINNTYTDSLTLLNDMISVPRIDQLSKYLKEVKIIDDSNDFTLLGECVVKTGFSSDIALCLIMAQKIKISSNNIINWISILLCSQIMGLTDIIPNTTLYTKYTKTKTHPGELYILDQVIRQNRRHVNPDFLNQLTKTKQKVKLAINEIKSMTCPSSISPPKTNNDTQNFTLILKEIYGKNCTLKKENAYRFTDLPHTVELNHRLITMTHPNYLGINRILKTNDLDDKTIVDPGLLIPI
jgi:HrpA-like RNA helicase